jgi:hypothetical protein
MWKYIIAFCLFCLVLFIYLHVQFHLKTSNDLEVLELENGSKDKLEETCDLRQPLIMDFYNDPIFNGCKKPSILGSYHAFELNIRNTKEEDYTSEIYIPMQSHSAFKLFDEDKTGSYITEKNQEFLQETGMLKLFQSNDEFIRPGLVSNCIYDIQFGSENATTPFRYEINYRNYFFVTNGTVEIKMAPPKCAKYLQAMEDYDNFEFRSPVNPWAVQEQYKYDFDKIKCMDVLLPAGKMIHIPAYWWYSIRYHSDATVASFKYRTYMNNVAVLPHIGMNFLQMQNVQHDVIKKYDGVKTMDQNTAQNVEQNVDTSVKTGTTNIDDLSSIPVLNELPNVNAVTNPVEEIEIPTTTSISAIESTYASNSSSLSELVSPISTV